MPTKKPTKRKVGRPKGSIKRTSLGEDVNHRLTKGETAMYLNVKNGLVDWIAVNGVDNQVTSTTLAIVLSGCAANQPFFFERLQNDPDIIRSVDIVRAKLFSQAISKVQHFAFQGGYPKYMEMYLRLISSDKDLGRLTGGVKFSDVSSLTIDNRKQINVVAPPADTASVKQPKGRRKQIPHVIQVIDPDNPDTIEDVEAVEVGNEEDTK